MENQKFQVEIETGVIKEAELITIVSIDGIEYAIYMIDNETGSVDILASYLKKDKEGYDVLVDIDSEEDKLKVAEFISNLVA